MKYTLFLLLSICWVIANAIIAPAQIISTYAGTSTSGYFGDGGQATAAKLYSPCGIVCDDLGNVYFTDEQNYCVRKITPSGIITTIAGIGGAPGYSGNNGPATAAHLSAIWGIARDGAGNFFITDQNNHNVRKVNTAGIITSLANDTTSTSSGNGGPVTAAHFIRPIGIAVDGLGNIYIGDADAHNIRKVDAVGIISQFAGTTGVYGYAGDGGPATNALLGTPNAIAADGSGNVYFCDGDQHCVRKINNAGIITTIAGTGTAGFSGDGSPAVNCKLNDPTGVFVDRAGNVLITDSHNQRLRRINKAGIINTIAGSGFGSFAGDGGLSTHADLFGPSNAVVDTENNIFITDTRNNRVRKVKMVLFFSNNHPHEIHICQNTSSISLDTLLSGSDQAIGLTDTWSLIPGGGPHHGTANVNFTAAATGATVIPSGTYYTPNTNFTGKDTIKILITNGIATDTETVYLTIDAFLNNAGNVVGDSAVCVGSSITLTDTALGGTWTISNLNAIVSGGIVTGQSAGIDTIFYTITNTCGSARAFKVVTVNPLPAIGKVVGQNELCVGAFISLYDSVAGGYWSATNANVLLDPTLNSCYVIGLLSGKDTVKYTISDSFCAATAVKIITIDSLPTSTIADGIPNLCIGHALSLSGIPGGGLWGIVNNSASFTNTPTGGIVTAISAGTDTIIYQVTNLCGSASSYYTFEVDTLPARPKITRSDNKLFTVKGYSTYQWLLNGIAIPGANSDSIVLNDEGIYNVIVSNKYGCSATADSLKFPGCEPEDIVIFPNPTESAVHLSWCKKVTIRVICMDGKTMKMVFNTSDIDLGEVPNADYLLAIYDENGKKLAVRKVTKLKR